MGLTTWIRSGFGTRPSRKARVTTRVVTESCWIHSDQLKVGMYVSELDRPWAETPFMFQGFTIESAEALEAVQACCSYAQVRLEKVAKVSSSSSERLVAAGRRRSAAL